MGFAEPRQVDSDYLTALRQLLDGRDPRSPPSAQTVHEQQRTATSTSDVIQRLTGTPSHADLGAVGRAAAGLTADVGTGYAV